MNRLLTLLTITSLLLVPAVAIGHELDHPAEGFTTSTPPSQTVLSGGEDAEWELITSIPTGNPHTDLDFFTQGGVTYASVGTIAAGGNAGGQTIVKLMDADGTVAPEFITGHPSATCGFTDPLAALGLQHDVEATPKGTAILNVTNPLADTSDAQLLLDATDARGRCHDQSPSGGILGSPQGGLEIVDITDIANPVEIALTSHIGQSHTVNVDPKRPHIAYSVTSDAVTVNNNGTPDDFSDDTVEAGNDLGGWEMVDLSSCMNFPADTTVADKRAACRPDVFRYRYETTEIGVGHTARGQLHGCHELEVYPEDVLSCGGGNAGILFDIAEVFNDQGTPDDYSDDTLNGTPLPCSVRAAAAGNIATTGAMVIDCTVTPGGEPLTNAGWEALGKPSVTGVEHLGSAHHYGGRSGVTTPDEDIQFNHEAELTDSRRFMIATDERGGGVSPPDASCAADNAVNESGNGGIAAYAVDRLDAIGDFPASMEEADEAFARTPEGDKALLRITPRAVGETFCTAHVFQQIPGQNRIFMGWYTQGTQVVDFIEHPDGTFEFIERAYFIPENANTWVSHVFDVKENEDGTFTYTGATGDFNLGSSGRSTIDVYRVTLPPPATPDDPGEEPTEPEQPTEPEEPSESDEPTEPEEPSESDEPTESEEPTETEEPTDDPTDDLATDDQVVRLAGDTRITTAIEISKDRFPDDGSAGAVVLSRGDDPIGFADALAGGPLAVDRDAPLLVTPPDELDDDVADEIDRVLDDGDTVFLLGGEQALSADVEQALDDAGYDTVRLAGGTRYDTAIEIADELGNPDLTLIATGDTFVDALAASAAAGANTGAVLLTPSEQRHPATDAYLAEHDPDRLVAVGGPAARPYDEAEQVIGADRFATATELADLLFDDPTTVGIARADTFPDALAGGAHVGALGGPILLSAPDDLDTTTEDHLCDTSDTIDLAYLYGGELALDDDVRDAVEAALDDDGTC